MPGHDTPAVAGRASRRPAIDTAPDPGAAHRAWHAAVIDPPRARGKVRHTETDRNVNRPRQSHTKATRPTLRGMKRSNVLVLSGHDPSGGAGLQADIEAVAAQGAHAASVVTALTRQDTHNVYGVVPVAEDFFAACIDTLLEDMQFSAIKTGVLATAGQVRIVAELAERLPGVPLVVDPVLVAAGGGELAGDPVARAMRDVLFRRATVITPNVDEARRLCDGEPIIDRCGAILGASGCHVLITGGDEGGSEVINRLYAPDGTTQSQAWPRLAGRFHGSGCTLAASLAARLAVGESLEEAVASAQSYTWQTLESGFTAGSGQSIPDRWPGRGP